MPDSRNSKVEAYILKSASFAQPILRHYRQLVHEVCPEVDETLKWSFPHFVRHGAILCSMAAFKAHCAFGFWHHDVQKLINQERGEENEGMGMFGRVSKIQDLPKDDVLCRYLRTAVELADSGKPAKPPRPKKRRPELPVPDDLAVALHKNKTARTTFTAFSPSHRREYIEWITEAKRPETRAKRVAATLEWLKVGKSRNWQYEKC